MDMTSELPAAELTVPQIAQHLGVSRQTVWKWCRSGRLIGALHGRAYRIEHDHFQAFLAEDWFAGRGRTKGEAQ